MPPPVPERTAGKQTEHEPTQSERAEREDGVAGVARCDGRVLGDRVVIASPLEYVRVVVGELVECRGSSPRHNPR